MNKPFRRLHKKKMKHIRQAESKQALWFAVRMAVCTVVFLAIAVIRFRGGAMHVSVKTKAEQFFDGTPKLTEAYKQSVDAITNFCRQWQQEPRRD